MSKGWLAIFTTKITRKYLEELLDLVVERVAGYLYDQKHQEVFRKTSEFGCREGDGYP